MGSVGDSAEMRILYVVIDGKFSGGNQICATLLRSALKAGHEVELLTPSLGPLTDALSKEGVRIHLLKLTRSFHVHKVLLLVFLLKSRRMDLVHTHTSLNSEILCRMACFLARIPIICHQHEPTDIDYANPVVAVYQRWLNRITSKFVTQFVAVSQSRREAIIKTRKYRADKIRLIYNGIDVNSFLFQNDRENIRQEWKLRPEQTAVGLIARLELPKGQGTLIEAVPMVLKRYPETRFFIIGGDHVPHQPSFHRYQKMIQDFGIGESCFLLGFKPEIQMLIQALDIVVLPSWWEGHPLVLLEALAAQKPVIASEVGGTPEIIDHEKSGLLISPRDPDALADAICRLIENPNLGKQMARHGYQKVVERFDQKRMIEQVLSLYD